MISRLALLTFSDYEANFISFKNNEKINILSSLFQGLFVTLHTYKSLFKRDCDFYNDLLRPGRSETLGVRGCGGLGGWLCLSRWCQGRLGRFVWSFRCHVPSLRLLPVVVCLGLWRLWPSCGALRTVSGVLLCRSSRLCVLNCDLCCIRRCGRRLVR